MFFSLVLLPFASWSFDFFVYYIFPKSCDSLSFCLVLIILCVTLFNNVSEVEIIVSCWIITGLQVLFIIIVTAMMWYYF